MGRARMSTSRVLAVVLAACMSGSTLSATPSSAGAPVVRTPADASYRFLLRTGPEGRTWRGSGSIAFTNVGADALDVVYLRLWSNGVLGCGARSIVVSGLRGGARTGLRLDCTELEVTLDEPLAPGARTTIAFDLRIRIPTKDDRFGYHRGLTLAGTALPTLAVHDDHGWHRAPFEDLGESFYSLVSDYDVTFVAPRGLETAASGVVTERALVGPGRRRTTYVARNVRDFAWAAGDLKRVVRTVGGTDIVVWFQPDALTRARARAVATDARRVMRVLGEAFGAYPYREIDVVLAGFGSFGGMEYPTIVFTEPARATVAHELAHQWFYGTVGNDQYREPWLDESFATWAMRLPFGPPTRGCRVSWPSADAALTNDMGYWSTHPAQYWLVYTGGGCMLSRLSARFGHARFRRLVGSYSRRHHLGIARTEDFTAMIETAAATHLPGFDIAAFWERWRVRPP